MSKQTFFKILALKLAALGATAAAVHLWAWRNMAKIRQNPDPYTPEQLHQEPRGEEHIITAVDGAQIRARVAGEGPTVVLVHGYADTIAKWNLIWHALVAQGYRVVAYDQRGHGRSTIGSYGMSIPHMATDLLAVLEYFEVRDGIVVGHSLGGFVTLAFLLNQRAVARRYVKHVLLLSSLAGRGLENAPQNQLQLPLLQSGLLLKVGQLKPYGWAFARTWVGDNPAASIVEAFRQTILTHDHEATMPALQATLD
ncbi:MAG: alpha/beta hydrolase, partial [Anaerolineales bacterium]|nr:alpha/beta hydrolase [Anaerolineales bacterium]